MVISFTINRAMDIRLNAFVILEINFSLQFHIRLECSYKKIIKTLSKSKRRTFTHLILYSVVIVTRRPVVGFSLNHV